MLALLWALLALSFAAALMFGEMPLSSLDVRGNPALRVILFDIRMPRALAAALVGAALGLCGAALQGLLRNPLAEPGVLGVSASAALGATFMLYSGLATTGEWAIPAGAIGCALLATALLTAAALRIRGTATLILAGVALSSIAGALMALLMNFAPNPFSLSDMMSWLMGSVANRSMNDLTLCGVPLLLGMAILLTQRHALTALTLGEATGQSLGISLSRVRLGIILGTGLASGAAVALAGAIGFVGLVAPHVVRGFFGHDPGRTLIPSALLGAIILLWADFAARMLPTTVEIRLGVLTALIGAPFFLLIALQKGHVRHD